MLPRPGNGSLPLNQPIASQVYMVDSFRVGECVVEPQLNRIRCGQRSARIEAKAMDVLVYLAGHPNEVLPKERIIQAAWPECR